MGQAGGSDEGWRARKRRETERRIADAALELFAARGFDATTLDAIAEAAGVARRTLFHYFESKEAILLAWQRDMPSALHAAILAEPDDAEPMNALRAAHLKLAGAFASARAIEIDRVLRSNDQLRAANQAKFIELEAAALAALLSRNPARPGRSELRAAAMIATGVLRLALDSWSEEGGTTPLADHVATGFEALSALGVVRKRPASPAEARRPIGPAPSR